MPPNLSTQEADSGMNIPNELLDEFTLQFEKGLSQWEEAMTTGNTRPIEEEMPANIICYFGRTGQDLMDVIDRDGIVSGMRQSVAALRGCRKHFENRVIRMRTAYEAVIFFEQVVERENRVLARLFTIETYRRVSGRWQCVREIVEHAGA